MVAASTRALRLLAASCSEPSSPAASRGEASPLLRLPPPSPPTISVSSLLKRASASAICASAALAPASPAASMGGSSEGLSSGTCIIPPPRAWGLDALAVSARLVAAALAPLALPCAIARAALRSSVRRRCCLRASTRASSARSRALRASLSGSAATPVPWVSPQEHATPTLPTGSASPSGVTVVAAGMVMTRS